MKPVRTPTSNLTLTITDPKTGERIPEADLPAERVTTTDGPAIESVWQPDDGERKALANGAPLRLVVWGGGHPPVQLAVDDPPDGVPALLDASHVERALGALYALLVLKADGEPGEDTLEVATSPSLTDDSASVSPNEFFEAFQTALDETREATGDVVPDTVDELLEQAGDQPPAEPDPPSA